jgi:predicted nuclease of predicted toxin-antitoxin system
MKVLIDECAPRALKRYLVSSGHECSTVQERDWSGIHNGELLTLAEGEFEVFITVDANLRYQQNLSGRNIAVIVICASSNRLEYLRPHFPACLIALEQIRPGQIFQIGISN